MMPIADSLLTEDAAAGHRFAVRLHRGRSHGAHGRGHRGEVAAAPAVRRGSAKLAKRPGELFGGKVWKMSTGWWFGTCFIFPCGYRYVYIYI